MKIHDLRPAEGSVTKKTRVGRGIAAGKGKTAGRGTKGQKARAGGNIPAWFEGGQTPLHQRLPKLRGFKNPFRVEFQVVNLDKLGELFPEGGAVTVENLVEKGAVRKNQPVKVLGTGDITVKVDVTVHAFSASAAERCLKISRTSSSFGSAASSFSLWPPIGSPRPRSVTSPVIATSRFTGIPVRVETIDVTMAMPAEGPSLGMAPAGTWICRSTFEKRSSLMPRSPPFERT